MASPAIRAPGTPALTPAFRAPTAPTPGTREPGTREPGLRTPTARTPAARTPARTPAARTPPARTPPARTPDIRALRMVRQARDRIDRDYADNLPMAKLAAEAGYSIGQFIRVFEAAYGETPGRYRSRRRVERACELLRSVNLSVTEVCMAVGFASLGTFSRRFSEMVGRSPSAYQRAAASLGGPAPIPGCFALMWHAGLPADHRPAADATAPDAIEPDAAEPT